MAAGKHSAPEERYTYEDGDQYYEDESDRGYAPDAPEDGADSAYPDGDYSGSDGYDGDPRLDYSEGEYDEDYEDYTDEEYYEVECPTCGEKICFTAEIDLDNFMCPACGNKIDDIELIDDCEECEGCAEDCECSGQCDGCAK